MPEELNLEGVWHSFYRNSTRLKPQLLLLLVFFCSMEDGIWTVESVFLESFKATFRVVGGDFVEER